MSWMVLALDTMENQSKIVTGARNSHPTGNVGLTQEIADGMRIQSGAADITCFRRLYISNPDLCEPAPYHSWCTQHRAHGYTDFSNE